MKEKTAENLADQIASLLKGNSARNDADLLSAIEKLNQRLDRLESRIAETEPAATAVKSEHPSLHKFKSLGEIADVILDRLNNQKDCPYEPTAKPCDNCSMCSSRGF